MKLGVFRECVISLIFLEIKLFSISLTLFSSQLKLWSSQQVSEISFFSLSQFLSYFDVHLNDFKDCLDSPKWTAEVTTGNFISVIVFIFCSHSNSKFVKSLTWTENSSYGKCKSSFLYENLKYFTKTSCHQAHWKKTPGYTLHKKLKTNFFVECWHQKYYLKLFQTN